MFWVIFCFKICTQIELLLVMLRVPPMATGNSSLHHRSETVQQNCSMLVQLKLFCNIRKRKTKSQNGSA